MKYITSLITFPVEAALYIRYGEIDCNTICYNLRVASARICWICPSLQRALPAQQQPYTVAATQKSFPSVIRFFYLAIPTLTILAGKAFIMDNKI